MDEQYKFITNPVYSDWQCEIFSGTVIKPLKGKEPNWFWRKMQYLILGFKWGKK